MTMLSLCGGWLLRGSPNIQSLQLLGMKPLLTIKGIKKNATWAIAIDIPMINVRWEASPVADMKEHEHTT
jgi:hypothetical protein